ncbi:MAG: peptidoglycan-binding domain-containing protein [Hyphomonas sp.]
MPEVLERAETIVRLKLEVQSIILDPPRLQPVGRSLDEYKSIANLVSRAVFFSAALEVFTKAAGLHGSISPKNLIAVAAASEGYDPSFTLRSQERLLAGRGVAFGSDMEFSIRLGTYRARGSIHLDVRHIGSASSKVTISIDISDIKDISKNVIAALIFYAITIQPLGGGVVVKSPTETLFVCSINVEMVGNRNELIQAAVNDLVVAEEISDEHLVSVWSARQLCLYRAGYDPGPIDGKYGPKTKAAEQKFSQMNGGIVVNWYSSAFAEYVITQANAKYQSEKTISEHFGVR